jgi:CRP-like cAMP-binding protein/class 3 adenylate cyclase
MSAPTAAALVSCDIVGHGLDPDHGAQTERIRGLNECIRGVCAGGFGHGIVWASGGDGGHVAFLDESLAEVSVRLIQELLRWAAGDGGPAARAPVRLRLTAHHGRVSIIEGADGRAQLVGDGINLCGSLLGFGTPGAVLVTQSFRDFLEQRQQKATDAWPGLEFHDDAHIYLKHFSATAVSFLSMPGVFSSRRGFPEKSDRIQLRESMEARRWWRTVYHAKRLLQVDSSDEDARRALQALNPRQLSFQVTGSSDFEAHPLLGLMNTSALGDLILAAHLVERDDGEIVCAREDSGDSMFIVLKGQIGVVISPAPSAADGDRRPQVDLCYGEGKILGELALALQRRRTATLQSVGATALLSVNYSTLRQLLSAEPRNVGLERSFNDFLRGRILEHLCRNTDYLAATENSPLSGIESPWEQMLHHSESLAYSWSEVELIAPTDENFRKPGLYILAGGRVREASQSERVRKALDESDHPLVYVDLPGELVSVQHRWRMDPDADLQSISFAHISDRALRSWGPRPYGRLVEAVKRRLARQFRFDAFISYNHRDELVARTWHDELVAAGLRVFMSQPEAMRRFKVEIELALVESLVMLPFVSLHAQSSDSSESWVQREIRCRRSLFDPDHSNILPIELTAGIAGDFADGFSAVTVTRDRAQAIAEVIRTVQSVRSGQIAPPFARRRVPLGTL